MDSQDPRDRLRRWADEQESREAAAAAVGCHPSYLSHLFNNEKRRPGLDVALGIQAATAGWAGGQIRVDEWREARAVDGRPPATGTDG